MKENTNEIEKKNRGNFSTEFVGWSIWVEKLLRADVFNSS